MAHKRALAVPTLVRQSDVAAEIERRKQAARAREEESMREASRREAPKVRVAAGPEGGKGVRLVEQTFTVFTPQRGYVKQTRFVDPLALAQKRRKDLVNRQTEAINSASRPIIEVLPDDYDEHEEKQEKKSKAKRQRSERDDDDEDMKELLAIINEKPGEEEEVGKQEIGMLLIEHPGEDTKKAAEGDDVDALFEEDPVSHQKKQLSLVSLPSRQSDIGFKSREEVRLERLQALKEERERENELRRKSIRMSRPDLVDEKALHRKEAYYQHNWRPPGNTNDRQTTTVIKPLSQKQYRRLQGQARARVLPANASSSVAKKRPHKNPRSKKKQRSSRNYRNQHWDSYGNWHDPDRDNFWKSGNNADRE